MSSRFEAECGLSRIVGVGEETLPCFRCVPEVVLENESRFLVVTDLSTWISSDGLLEDLTGDRKLDDGFWGLASKPFATSDVFSEALILGWVKLLFWVFRTEPGHEDRFSPL